MATRKQMQTWTVSVQAQRARRREGLRLHTGQVAGADGRACLALTGIAQWVTEARLSKDLSGRPPREQNSNKQVELDFNPTGEKHRLVVESIRKMEHSTPSWRRAGTAGTVPAEQVRDPVSKEGLVELVSDFQTLVLSEVFTDPCKGKKCLCKGGYTCTCVGGYYARPYGWVHVCTHVYMMGGYICMCMGGYICMY